MTFELVDEPRNLSDSEIKAFQNNLKKIEEPTKDIDLTIDQKISCDPELLRMNRAAEKELLHERKYWAEVIGKTSRKTNRIFSSSRIMVEGAVAGTPAAAGSGGCQSYARAYRYLVSQAFVQAWKSGNYAKIANDVVVELALGAAMDFSKLKDRFMAGLEDVLSKVTKNKAAKTVIPVILMFIVMLFATPTDGRLWSDLPALCFVAGLKTAILYACNIWVGVLLIDIIDDFFLIRKDLLKAGYDNNLKMNVTALGGALRDSPIVAVPLSFFHWIWGNSSDSNPTLEDDDFFCHESFVDNFGDLDKLKDPVFIHGYQTERSTADTLIHNAFNHPITKKRFLRAHIMEPTAEYKKAYEGYVRRRSVIIEKSTKKD